MKIAFLDLGGWSYSFETPLHEPMGGTESALCYLAKEMAQLGHEVTIYNGTDTAFGSKGIAVRAWTEIHTGALNQYDVVIVKSQAMGRELRERGITVPLILWTQHDVNQPAVKPLIARKECESWTGIAYVSDWQRERYEAYFQAPKDRGRVMCNAASPAFLNAATIDATEGPPVLFYTSTPYRGLDVLLAAFPAIRAATDAELRVYSSMDVYRVPAEADQCRALYDQCRTMEGVHYIGSVGQERLAAELADATALAYPSTFPETSCIAVIEAMATGAAVFSTDLGAIPETSGTHASRIPVGTDKADLVTRYIGLAIAELQWMRDNPADAAAQRYQRSCYIRDNYSWPARAKEWEAWLMELTGQAVAEAAE